MKLDIIIPCWEAKETLDKTLSSIADQEGFSDFSVCLVNDCSSYNYSSFVKKYSKFFPIRELSLKKNGGPGLARNAGIKETKNPYILFIDSDDYLYSKRALSVLMNKLNQKDYDLIVSDFLYERDGERTIKKRNPVWLHGKVFKRSFLEKHHILFNQSRANEDGGFNRLIIFMNPIIGFVDQVTYVYSENKDSITRKNNREYRFKGLEGYTYNMKWAMEEAIKREGDPKEIARLAIDVLVRMYFYYMELYEQYDVSKLLEWSSEIYQLYNQFPNNKASEEEIEDTYNHYLNEYKTQNTPFTECLTFQEFLDKVKEI